MPRLLTLRAWNVADVPRQNGGPQPRASSPLSGRSILSTSAPSIARM
jgi:hypothetical protein